MFKNNIISKLYIKIYVVYTPFCLNTHLLPERSEPLGSSWSSGGFWGLAFPKPHVFQIHSVRSQKKGAAEGEHRGPGQRSHGMQTARFWSVGWFQFCPRFRFLRLLSVDKKGCESAWSLFRFVNSKWGFFCRLFVGTGVANMCFTVDNLKGQGCSLVFGRLGLFVCFGLAPAPSARRAAKVLILIKQQAELLKEWTYECLMPIYRTIIIGRTYML